MSQQEMNFNDIHLEGSTHSYAGYEGVGHSDDYSTSFYGQKLSGQAEPKASNAGHRGPALAIASLVLWLLFFLFALFASAALNGTSISGVFGLFLWLGVLFFTALVIIINALFYRGRR